jgi:hypothetical protein
MAVKHYRFEADNRRLEIAGVTLEPGDEIDLEETLAAQFPGLVETAGLSAETTVITPDQPAGWPPQPQTGTAPVQNVGYGGASE